MFQRIITLLVYDIKSKIESELSCMTSLGTDEKLQETIKTLNPYIVPICGVGRINFRFANERSKDISKKLFRTSD